MERKNPLSRSLGPALLIAVFSAAAGLALALLPHVGSFEDMSLDLRFKLRGPENTDDSPIVVIYVDEDSIEFYRDTLGRWPWPREIYGHMVDYIAAGAPQAIAFDLLFYEPDLDDPSSDRRLAEATGRAGMVYHAFTLSRGGSPPPESVRSHAAGMVRDPARVVPAFPGGEFPLPQIAAEAAGLGGVNYIADADGPSRRIAPFYRVGDRYYPSLPLAVTAPPGGLANPVIEKKGSGWSLRAGSLEIPLTGKGEMLINWPGPPPAYPTYAAGEIIESILKERKGEAPAVPATVFRDKIVLVGSSAVALFDMRVSPFSPVTPGVDTNAAAIDTILRGNHLRALEGPWTFILSLALAGLTSILAVVGRGRRWLLGAAAIGLLCYPAAVHGAFLRDGLWVPLVFPFVSGALALTLSYAYNYRVESQEKKWMRAALARCVPPQVAGEIVRDPEMLRLGAGTRKTVTTLFTDIRGFTPLSENLEPEEVCLTLTRYFTAMVNVIFAHGGTVLQYAGDEIMVIFNAPLKQPGHALAAARCSLAMARALDELNGVFAAEGRPPIRTGTGINTGTVVAGFMGAEQRMDYSVVGDPVNVASRLEGLTKEYGTPIIISETTRDLIGGKAIGEKLGEVLVKGKKKPVTIYQLKGLEGE